ncbi:hypothetical protein AVEN_171066-1 [Araneus ventricosus]|uniref:Uncharacterized protein n=1 Tax=Araneus ventricosus TaxID=182803 RepID=A0A4Y2MWX8_ARAVE|nr:hypothetical protein AVEN_171066-1 [Araneus ventricosus]
MRIGSKSSVHSKAMERINLVKGEFHHRKERKGKEKKRKERKGKERRGEERKGKERKGKERKGKEPTPT